MEETSANAPVLNEKRNVAYLPAAHAVVSFAGMTNLLGVMQPSRSFSMATPTEPVVRPETIRGDENIAYWGSGNDFPQQVIKQARKNPIIEQGLADKAALWVGGGIIATADEKSEEWVDDQEIRDFLTSEATNDYLIEAMTDFAWWWNAFPEVILSKDREKITEIHSNKTAFCRWGRMDPVTGQLDTVFINANWGMGVRSTSPETIVLPAINTRRIDRVDAVRTGKYYKYIYPISFPSQGRNYYQLAAWESIRSSGWLDVIEAIPLFKKYGLLNQMTLKYHIEVPADYWEQAYPDQWEVVENRKAIQDEFLADLTLKLTDVQNANKTIMTTKIFTQDGQETGIVINVLGDKQVEGKYNLDYSEGLKSLCYALGLDPTLFGFSSDSIGARSGGSDKREAFWIFVSKSKPYRDRVLSPIKFIAEYNGWKKRYPNLCIKLIDTLLTTLDTGKSTTQVQTPTGQ